MLLIKNHFDVQDLLTRHKVLVAEHLEQNYDAVSDPAHTHAHMHRPTSMHFTIFVRTFVGKMYCPETNP